MDAKEVIDGLKTERDGWFSRAAEVVKNLAADHEFLECERQKLYGAVEQLTAERDELQKRSLTPDEVQLIRDIIDDIENERRFLKGGQTETDLRKMLSRISPPPVEWVDVGDGAIATLNGWTLTVRPGFYGEHNKFASSATTHGRAGVVDLCDGKDAAKAAAVAWVMQNGKAAK